MKAAIYTSYGPPEVVQLADIEKPVAKNNEVLIKVYASTVNRTDCGFRSAEYFISRFWSGLLRPKNQVLGNEFAGVVESVGKDVTAFKTGDRIFGYNDAKFGAHAEYMVMPENGNVAKLPETISFAEAAAATEGSHYALCNIRAAKVGKGHQVLVNGTTGAIGSAAVQLLKHFGAEVVAVCDTKNIALVKSLGADEIIDYQKEDFTRMNKKFDFVFDAVGKSTFGKCKPLLKEKGIYISTELGPMGQNPFLAIFTPMFGGRKLLFPIPTMNQADTNFLRDLLASGEFKPVIDRHYNLDQIVEAHKFVETGMKTGNVIIDIAAS